MALSGMGSVSKTHFPEGACVHLRQAPETLADFGTTEFEKGSSLAGYHQYSYSCEPLTDEDAAVVDHNPSPSML